MAAAQSELSMDEILASIRRIIHEEEDPRNERPRDTTNTVNLREEQEVPAQPSEILAEAEAKDVREVQLTSAAPQAPAPAETPQAPALENQSVLEEAFDTAGLRALVSEEVASRKVDAKPLAKPPATEEKPAAPEVQAAAAQAPVAEPEPTPEPVVETPVEAVAAVEEVPMVEPAAPEATVLDDVKSLVAGAEADSITAAFAGLKKTVEISNSTESRTLEGMVEDMLRPMMKAWLDENLRPMVEAKVDAEISRLTGK